MQDEKIILYKLLGQLFKEARLKKGISYTNFCYENDIAMSTYDDIIAARHDVNLYNIFKIIRALGLNFEEFGKLLDSELPPEIWDVEE